MGRLKLAFAGTFGAFALSLGGLAVLYPAPAGAVGDLFGQVCTGSRVDSAVCKEKTQQGSQNPVAQTIGNIARILAVVIGVAAVIVIIIGGLLFITSAGDSGKVARARSLILYAVVGIIVAALAGAITTFITNRI